MHGPVWNDPNVGITGEPLRGPVAEPNFVTTTNSEGKTVTLTGAAATAFRETGSA